MYFIRKCCCWWWWWWWMVMVMIRTRQTANFFCRISLKNRRVFIQLRRLCRTVVSFVSWSLKRNCPLSIGKATGQHRSLWLVSSVEFTRARLLTQYSVLNSWSAVVGIGWWNQSSSSTVIETIETIDVKVLLRQENDYLLRLLRQLQVSTGSGPSLLEMTL